MRSPSESAGKAGRFRPRIRKAALILSAQASSLLCSLGPILSPRGLEEEEPRPGLAHPVLRPLWLSVGDRGSQRHSDFRLSWERCFLMFVPKGSSRTGTRGWPVGLRVLL